MALRVLLVGLVAALGLDLPTSGELAGWRNSGQAWASARLSDLSRLRFEVDRPLSGPSEHVMSEDGPAVAITEAAPLIRSDLAFEAVVEGMAECFSSDYASRKRPNSSTEKVAASVDPVQEFTPATAIVQEPPPPADSPTATVSRIEKISTAVRLTQQAVDAWASIIQPILDPVNEDGSGDAF